MNTTPNPNTDRPDAPAYEPNPSVGWREIAHAMHAPDANAAEDTPDADDDVTSLDSMVDISPSLEVAL